MADALISPAVGGAMWGASAATAVYSARRVRRQQDLDEAKAPLMGIAGAFVFAAQMLNFTIPGTGSSGHLAGGLLLAILLGPEAAFLVMASILAVQALFFADGGLLALGCNIFNLGFFPAFVAYPFVYRPIVGPAPRARRVVAGSLLAGIVALELGALAVVLETTFSGVSELEPRQFLLLMLPIHLVIGVVEGLVTGAVVVFIMRAQPDLLSRSAGGRSLRGLRLRPVLLGLGAAAVLAAAVLSWFASTNPDGLEWSLERVTRSGHGDAAQTGTAKDGAQASDAAAAGDDDEAAGDTVDVGVSLAGVVGAAIVMVVVLAVGVALRRRSPSGGARGP